MKRLKGIVAAGMIVLAGVLAGCGGQTEQVQQIQEAVGMDVEHWEIPDVVQSNLSDEEQAIFDKAMEGLLGVNYEPVAVIATQLVSGTNRAYLARGTVVYPDASPTWYVISIYENLQGEVELLDIREFDVDNPLYLEEDAGTLMGAWKAAEPSFSVLPADAADAYDAGMEGITGVDYQPIALLGTAEGGNYLVLCYGVPVTPSGTPGLYLAQVGGNQDAGISIAMVSQLDINSYVFG